MKGFWGATESIAATVKAATRTSAGGQPQQPQQQFLRLPLESARRLRWFDAGDLAALAREHTADKEVLHEALLALRLALTERGIEV